MNDVRRLEPGTGPIAGDSPDKARKWTFMVYLAGDNNLEEHGRSDLEEMKEVGSSPEVTIVAQFDRMQEGATRRYHLTKGGTVEEDEVEAHLGETNTGDPRELARFLAWAMNEYPAERYALVLWNHGLGWKEEDVYGVAQASGVYHATRAQALASLADGFVARTERPPLFASTVDSVLARGIAYDDTSCDFLDNGELKRALGCGLLFGGAERFSLLGFDACLMNMLEVAYQVKDVTEYLVGSQETEPSGGWPYGPILRALVDRPAMDGEELARVVVDSYVASYVAGENLSQSALNLAHIRDVVYALDEMCAYVLDHEQECELIMGRASRRAQKFSDPDYKDLHDLCRQLRDRSDRVPELQARSQAVMDLIVPAGYGRFVCAEGHRGYRLVRANGVSIYFPHHEMSPFYKRLDFASESLWDDMLHRLFGV